MTIFRKAMNSSSDISPDAMANSRWTIAPLPLTLPEISTLNGASVNTMSASVPRMSCR